MKKALTLLIFCFALLPLTAQNNWSSATLVKTEGDTLRGLIDFQNWRKNPSRIQFRSTSQATQESFGPLDLQSFWVPEESVHFQSAVVEVDFSPFATQQLTVDQQADFRLDTVFLRSVFLGAVNLYFLRDRDTKEHFFLQRPGGAIEELQYLRYLEEVGGKKVVKTKDIYKTQLLEYLGDCPAARNLIAGVRYREQDLLEILLAYQNCQAGAEPEFVGKTDLGRFIFGVAAAGILSKYDFVASSAPTLDEVEFEYCPNFGIAASMEYILPRNRGKWSFYSELMWKTKHVLLTEENVNAIIAKREWELDLSYLCLNAQFRYNYPTGRIRPFVGLGFSYGYATKANSRYYEERNIIGIPDVSESKLISPIRKYELGALLTLGARHGRFALDARYEIGNGLSPSIDLRSTSNSIFLVLSYQFADR